MEPETGAAISVLFIVGFCVLYYVFMRTVERKAANAIDNAVHKAMKGKNPPQEIRLADKLGITDPSQIFAQEPAQGASASASPSPSSPGQRESVRQPQGRNPEQPADAVVQPVDASVQGVVAGNAASNGADPWENSVRGASEGGHVEQPNRTQATPDDEVMD